MIEILEYLEKAGLIISLFAVLIIVCGLVKAAWCYVRRYKSKTRKENFILFKIEFGQLLLVGLEVLVLADVIETITVTPTVLSLLYLAGIIAIRTVVSWTLYLETEGHWPWKATSEEQSSA